MFTNLKEGRGVSEIAAFIVSEGLLEPKKVEPPSPCPS
jgi:hypothetical protein